MTVIGNQHFKVFIQEMQLKLSLGAPFMISIYICIKNEM